MSERESRGEPKGWSKRLARFRSRRPAKPPGAPQGWVMRAFELVHKLLTGAAALAALLRLLF